MCACASLNFLTCTSVTTAAAEDESPRDGGSTAASGMLIAWLPQGVGDTTFMETLTSAYCGRYTWNTKCKPTAIKAANETAIKAANETALDQGR